MDSRSSRSALIFCSIFNWSSLSFSWPNEPPNPPPPAPPAEISSIPTAAAPPPLIPFGVPAAPGGGLEPGISPDCDTAIGAIRPRPGTSAVAAVVANAPAPPLKFPVNRFFRLAKYLPHETIADARSPSKLAKYFSSSTLTPRGGCRSPRCSLFERRLALLNYFL